MNPNLFEQIIRDLGPTGLLILGLYFITGRFAEKICDRLHKINDELGQIIDLLKKAPWQN